MGVSKSCNAHVVRNWYQNFQMKRKLAMKTKTKHDLPPLLERNQELCIQIKEYVCEHLAELSSEMLCEYMHNVVMPILVKDETGVEKENVGCTDHLKPTLGKYGLTKIFLSTCYNWLRQLGLQYCTQKKGYFVDRHEKPATAAYWDAFISCYFEYERRTQRWVQLSASQAIDLQEKGMMMKNTGLSF
jgi:hypothetical protein